LKKKIIKTSVNTIKMGIKTIIIKKKYGNILNKLEQLGYLDANPDVLGEIKHGQFRSAEEHFVLYGLKEVQEGKRPLGRNLPSFDEALYLSGNSDVKVRVEDGTFMSGFHHFLRFGYKEILNGTRVWKSSESVKFTPQTNPVSDKSESLTNSTPDEHSSPINSFYELFDESAYLKANPDVKESISKGEFASGWEHFSLIGYQECQRGERAIHPDIPKMSEKEYLQGYSDIDAAHQDGSISSPFKHFLFSGIQEILNGSRPLLKSGKYHYRLPHLTKKIKNEMEAFHHQPLISIIMPVYNVDPKWLGLAIGSLKEQWYANWELCIADDASTQKETLQYLESIQDEKIKITYLKKNLNISGASNEALKLAGGEYIALMDNDDELTSDALYEVVKTINQTDAEFIYSDEDKLELNGNILNRTLHLTCF